MEIIRKDGHEFVRMAVASFVHPSTGRRVRAIDHGKKAFFIDIPVDKFLPREEFLKKQAAKRKGKSN